MVLDLVLGEEIFNYSNIAGVTLWSYQAQSEKNWRYIGALRASAVRQLPYS